MWRVYAGFFFLDCITFTYLLVRRSLNRDGILDAMQEVAGASPGQWAQVPELRAQQGKGLG